MPNAGWTLFPQFILRSTGFPFGWIGELAFCDTSSAIDALLVCEDEISTRRPTLQARLSREESGSIPARRHAWKCVNKWRVFRFDEQDGSALASDLIPALEAWNVLLARREELGRCARACFERELAAKRRALRDIARDPWFQEAVWLSSPQMYEHGLERYLRHWNEGARSTEVRSAERQIVSFLQRFCAKNDTASFFGPINYGDFEPSRGDPPGPRREHLRTRRGTIAYWAVCALAEAIARDGLVLPYLTPRRLPLARFDPVLRTLLVGRSTRRTLDLAEAQVFALSDGKCTLEDAASELRRSMDETLGIARRLESYRAIALAPGVPVTELSPIDWLVEWAERLPSQCAARARWGRILRNFSTLQQNFGPAAFPEKQKILQELEQAFSAATAQPARHSGGAFYADRLIIYEECLGGATPLSLGPEFAARLQKELAPILQLCASIACGVRQQLAAFGAGLLARWYGGKPVPWLDFVSRFSKDRPCFNPEPTPWQEAVLEQVRAAGDEHEVRIDPAALPPVDASMMAVWPLVASPDVMLLANYVSELRTGDFDIVFSECHDTFMLWGWALSLHPEWAALERDAELMLDRARGNWSLANVLTSKRVKIMPFEFPGLTIELMAQSGQKAPAERISAFDVEVRDIGGRLCLFASGEPVLLYNGELHSLAHSMFSLPRVVPPLFDAGPHTPRLRQGSVVVQRERWRVSRGQLFPRAHSGSSLDLFMDFRRAVRALGLPRYLYASMPGQPKPVFIDCQNYFVIEMLYSFAPEEGDIVLVEMLPGPDRLWLRDGADRYCAELRLSACYLPVKQ